MIPFFLWPSFQEHLRAAGTGRKHRLQVEAARRPATLHTLTRQLRRQIERRKARLMEA